MTKWTSYQSIIYTHTHLNVKSWNASMSSAKDIYIYILWLTAGKQTSFVNKISSLRVVIVFNKLLFKIINSIHIKKLVHKMEESISHTKFRNLIRYCWAIIESNSCQSVSHFCATITHIHTRDSLYMTKPSGFHCNNKINQNIQILTTFYHSTFVKYEKNTDF